MIIIYFGRCPYLPFAACQLHLGKQQLTVPQNSCPASSFVYAGTDQCGNIVCSLATGGYNDIYRRALTGICQIFMVDIALIDVDRLCARFDKAGILSMLAEWFPGIFGAYWQKQLSNILVQAKIHQQGDNS